MAGRPALAALAAEDGARPLPPLVVAVDRGRAPVLPAGAGRGASGTARWELELRTETGPVFSSGGRAGARTLVVTPPSCRPVGEASGEDRAVGIWTNLRPSRSRKMRLAVVDLARDPAVAKGMRRTRRR